MDGTMSNSQVVAKKKVVKKKKPGNILTFLFLCVLVVVFLYPIVFIVIN